MNAHMSMYMYSHTSTGLDTALKGHFLLFVCLSLCKPEVGYAVFSPKMPANLPSLAILTILTGAVFGKKKKKKNCRKDSQAAKRGKETFLFHHFSSQLL